MLCSLFHFFYIKLLILKLKNISESFPSFLLLSYLFLFDFSPHVLVLLLKFFNCLIFILHLCYPLLNIHMFISAPKYIYIYIYYSPQPCIPLDRRKLSVILIKNTADCWYSRNTGYNFHINNVSSTPQYTYPCSYVQFTVKPILYV